MEYDNAIDGHKERYKIRNKVANRSSWLSHRVKCIENRVANPTNHRDPY